MWGCNCTLFSYSKPSFYLLGYCSTSLVDSFKQVRPVCLANGGRILPLDQSKLAMGTIIWLHWIECVDLRSLSLVSFFSSSSFCRLSSCVSFVVIHSLLDFTWRFWTLMPPGLNLHVFFFFFCWRTLTILNPALLLLKSMTFHLKRVISFLANCRINLWIGFWVF